MCRSIVSPAARPMMMISMLNGEGRLRMKNEYEKWLKYSNKCFCTTEAGRGVLMMSPCHESHCHMSHPMDILGHVYTCQLMMSLFAEKTSKHNKQSVENPAVRRLAASEIETEKP